MTNGFRQWHPDVVSAFQKMMDRYSEDGGLADLGDGYNMTHLCEVFEWLRSNTAPDAHPNAADYRNRAERAEAELAEVRAEVAKLRNALRLISGLMDDDGFDFGELCESLGNITRAALNGGKHEQLL